MKPLFTLFAFGLFTLLQGSSPWPVPSAFEEMKNPVPASSYSVSIGKALYKAHCRSCHQQSDIKLANTAYLTAPPLNAKLLSDQSDGSLFYKIREGRNEVHAFKYQIPSEEDSWHLVNYLRSL